MSWYFLTSLLGLGEIPNHSTLIGKVWLAVLIVLRIVVIAVVGEPIYSDEQTEFQCDTLATGCENGCYDAHLPFSPIRFWSLQVIVIITPTLMYVVYAMHKIAHTEGAKDQAWDKTKMRIHPERKKEVPENQFKHDGRRGIKDDGLMKVYVVQLLVRGTLEAVFLYVQYMVYGLEVVRVFDCTTIPECVDRDPEVKVTRCFESRPNEKTILLHIMYGVSGLCLLFTTLEIIYLGFSALRDCCCTPRHTAAPSRSGGLPPHSVTCLHTVMEIEDEERGGCRPVSQQQPQSNGIAVQCPSEPTGLRTGEAEQPQFCLSCTKFGRHI